MSTKYPTSAEVAVRNVDMPWLSWVSQADPQWQSDKHWVLEYEFSRRTFFGDPYQRGVYGSSFLKSETGGILLDDSSGKLKEG
jgi:hypothetical protein